MTRRLHILVRMLLLAPLALLAPRPALAQATGNKAPAKSRVVTVSEVTIVGRVQKPIAAVDVSRIRPRLTVNQQNIKLLPEVRKALFRAPF